HSQRHRRLPNKTRPAQHLSHPIPGMRNNERTPTPPIGNFPSRLLPPCSATPATTAATELTSSKTPSSSPPPTPPKLFTPPPNHPNTQPPIGPSCSPSSPLCP